MIEKALDEFGTTNDCSFGAYILPDGKLLDFEVAAGRGEHHNISAIYPEKVGAYKSIAKFLHDTGSIRFNHGQNTTWVEMSEKHEPTFDQFEAVRACACRQGLDPHRIIYDIYGEKEGFVYQSGDVKSQFRELPCNTIVNKFMHELMGKYV